MGLRLLLQGIFLAQGLNLSLLHFPTLQLIFTTEPLGTEAHFMSV